ncbi:MAG: roadblock/LC7 domain-containing protein [Candidatus Thermoplasmatota archaeon]|nr:roadblock/LC7 domain-containing protein [Candidatus Thermoplasmatota archaeon]
MADEFRDILENLKRKGVYGSAVVDKEGGIIESDLPRNVHEDTFGIMCATIIGASNSANSELGRGSVRRIIVDSEEGKVIITSAGEDLLLSVVVDASRKLGTLFEEINKSVETIKEST